MLADAGEQGPTPNANDAHRVGYFQHSVHLPLPDGNAAQVDRFWAEEILQRSLVLARLPHFGCKTSQWR